MINLEQSFEDIFNVLLKNTFDESVLFQALSTERKNQNRKPVIYALIRCINGKKGTESFTIEKIMQSVKAMETKARKRFVRNTYKKTSIWAIEEIKKKYPNYTESNLIDDLKPKKKSRKIKLLTSFRDKQIEKLYKLIMGIDESHENYNKYCNMIATNINSYNKAITYQVSKEDKTKTFTFPAKTKEEIVVTFLKGISKAKTINEVDKIYNHLFNIHYGK